MDAVTEKNLTSEFPFESLQRLRTNIAAFTEEEPGATTKAFDNRGRVSSFTSLLSSNLSSFQTRLKSSSFISDTFTWQIKTAVTSDPTGLLAKASQQAQDKDYSVSASRLASVRTVGTHKLDSDDATDFETGTYSFSLTDGDDQFSIDIEIDSPIGARATNKEVLSEIETAINRLPSNVEATLHESQVRDYNPFREDVYKEVVYLTLQSKSTGEDMDFTLADTSQTLIDDLGLNNIRSFGSNSQYSVNGESSSSSSNAISLDSGNLTAYLLKTTDTGESFAIKLEKDFQSLENELTDIITDYNDLIQWLDDNDEIINPGLKATILEDISSITVKNRNLMKVEDTSTLVGKLGSSAMVSNETIIDNELKKIGLGINSDGSLEITEDFSDALRADLKSVHDILAGTNGFFTKINASIDKIVGKSESNYVFSKNSVLSYDTTVSARTLYQQNLEPLINVFA